MSERRRLEYGGGMNPQLAAMLARSKNTPQENLILTLGDIGAAYINKTAEEEKAKQTQEAENRALSLFRKSPAYAEKMQDGSTINWNASEGSLDAALAALPEDSDLARKLMEVDFDRTAKTEDRAYRDQADERNFAQQKDLAAYQNDLSKQLVRETAALRPKEARNIQTVETAEGVFTVNPDGTLGNRLGGTQKTLNDPLARDEYRASRKDVAEMMDASKSADASIDMLNRIGGLQKDTFVQGPLTKLLPNVSDAATEISSLQSGLSLSSNAALKGATSDKDIAFLMAQQPGTDKSAATNNEIIAGQKAALNRIKEKSNFFDKYLRTNKTTLGAAEEWDKYVKANPLVDPKTGKLLKAGATDDKMRRLEELRAKKAGGQP